MAPQKKDLTMPNPAPIQPKAATHVMLVEVHVVGNRLPCVTYIFYGETSAEAEEAFSRHCAVDDLLCMASLSGEIPRQSTERERDIARLRPKMRAILTNSEELAKHLGKGS